MYRCYLILVAVVLLLEGCSYSPNPVPEKPRYIDCGREKNEDIYPGYRLDIIFNEAELEARKEWHGETLFSPYNKKQYLIPNAETAYKIANLYLIKRYGLERVKEARPFVVYLENKVFWHVKESENYSRRKGGLKMHCIINRIDGRTKIILE